VAIVLAGGTTAEAFAGGTVKMMIKIAQWPVAIFLVLLGFALVYFFAPDIKEQKWHWITPSPCRSRFVAGGILRVEGVSALF
jgi:uncharacterized BrkB/YihY/UPF0761 family membrane protein